MKSIAVIGAGASGLTAIKCCLDEGLEPVCFERVNYISGLWHYTEDVEEGQACVMKSTVINTSKEMMCYSDFPIPGEFPIYMHNKYVDRYFHMYADKFGLRKYINFNTEVLSVKPTKTFNSDGQWEIAIKTSDKEETRVFDAVLICTGHHAEKNIPNFPGLNKFKGKVTHTHDYKDYHGYEDKNVLIIGIGNSGGDVATELSRISSQVYLSTRSGSWIFHRVDDKGLPGDMMHSTRLNTKLLKSFPNMLISLAEKKLNNKFDHEKYCLKPKHGLFSAHPTLNDELPNRIISGGVIVKANVAEFTETGAIFEDGTKIDNLDAVVLATGYIFGFPFIDKSVIEVKANKVNLYKYMFPPDLQKHTMAIIGCFQPLGAIMPMSEMQCRLATRVFKGLKTLPESTEMWEDIKSKQAAMGMRYKQSLRHTIQVDYVPYMDELAEMVGCKPNVRKLILTDPKLAMEVFFGPCTPCQYRLMGPGPWKGARNAIMTQWERVYKPLQTRPCAKTERKSSGAIYMLIVAVIAVLLYFIL
ncbi:LOW QUALITY PROTEIN: flavin-containing monooxygenase 5-like [Ruditapes philippinarum]|uniref:LOW QUALITY PROTEIN: flavin-containing monooxygenase 5-like n=1 Tax=Ruditapes philippinarum TaxID=129788 RepID=UPI00295BEEA0|nr:LOW QUALITY PROTEIN: flavin-containing monooxygenase 5-like [Ruditapes philippinarum]